MRKITIISVFVLMITGAVSAQGVLPKPQVPFKGHINLDAKNSEMDFPKAVTPPKGAPNVLLVMLDDVGFGAASTFGGPINTPNLEKLAKKGLIFNQFHTRLCVRQRGRPYLREEIIIRHIQVRLWN
jgi:hypothetical protein